MRFHKMFPIIAISACLLILGGCIIKDSPAPGCVESIGFPAMGGCSGKTAIVDLEVESAPDCVVIEANNCNGGVLEIRNNCEDTLQLDGMEISPVNSISLDFREADGSLDLLEAHGNFSQFAPVEDREIEITGTLGSQTIRIVLTKTKPLCE